jgi:hypothetical protein
MVRTALVSLLAALVVLAGCGGDGDGGGGDSTRFTDADVQKHYKQETGFELVVVARNQVVDILKPKPSPAANKRYGFFTAHVTKNKGAVDAIRKTPLPGSTLKVFGNVVVEWSYVDGGDRPAYERSLTVFSSLGK